jgi:flavin-binding protein dodecin
VGWHKGNHLGYDIQSRFTRQCLHVSKLLDALGRSGNIPHTVFGSLNYDCLFEQAASHFGFTPRYEWDNAEKLDSVRIAKIHGSSNFIAQIDQRTMAILAGTNVHVEVPVTILSVENLEKELGEKISGRRTLYLPVMSQVSHYKEQPLATGAIQRMRNGWNAGVRHAKVIAIIGVSFNSYDQHIIEEIKNASRTVLYIGDEESFKKWQAVNKSAQWLGERLEDGFDKLLTHLGM